MLNKGRISDELAGSVEKSSNLGSKKRKAAWSDDFVSIFHIDKSIYRVKKVQHISNYSKSFQLQVQR